jgi:acetylornithine deacetylase
MRPKTMQTRELLDRLIGFATVSRDSNLELIQFVRDFLTARGIACRIYEDPTGRKANLYATVGPADGRGVLLSGHTDVVPVDGQAWSTDPFQLTERAGRLYGRGTADMKGFIACALRAADRATDRSLRSPLHLAFSYDEEVGCLGVRSLIDDMSTWAVRPALCIVGEPTLLRTAVGHKGKMALRAVCHGHAAHSAYPDQGLNAIHLATDLVRCVRDRQEALLAHGARDEAYAVPYSTLHVGVIRGGTALNIVPDRCELDLEIRHLAADDPDALLAGLRADAAAIASAATQPGRTAAIDVAVTNAYPGLDTPVDHELVALVAELTGLPGTIKVGFGSEGGLFSGQLGIPTVVCGPGSIDQGHKPDEFIGVDQLDRCDAMLDALLDRLAV